MSGRGRHWRRPRLEVLCWAEIGGIGQRRRPVRLPLLLRARTRRTARHIAFGEVERLRRNGTTTLIGFARELTALGVPTPRRGCAWTHTTVARVMGRARSVERVPDG